MQYCEFRWISLVDILEFKQPTQMKFQSVSNYVINYMCSLERHIICLLDALCVPRQSLY